MTWDEWLNINREKIKHVAGFEEQFVNTVLRKIPEITPEDLISQYHFSDFHNGNRYIDFMIINKDKGYSLPIELDGLWKVQNYSDFNDMLERQNALISQYGILLRYTNKQMINSPSLIISNIREVLNRQEQKLSTQKIAEDELQFTIKEYQTILESLANNLKEQNANDQSELQFNELKNKIGALEVKLKEIQEIKNGNSQNIEITSSNIKVKENLKIYKFVSIGFAAAFIISSALLYFQSSSVNYSVKNTNTSTESVSHLTTKNTLSNEVNQKLSVETSTTDKPGYSVSNKQMESESSVLIQLSKVKNDLKNKILAFFSLPSNSRSSDAQTNKKIKNSVSAKEAQKYIGEQKIVCGQVEQVKKFNKGFYLNLGNRFPYQEATLVIWSNNADKFDNLSSYEGNLICVNGLIDTYKGSPQIELSEPSQIQN